METAKIKKFATEARNILKAGIAARLTGLGFDCKGQVPDNNKPQLLQGGCIWNGRTLPEGFYHQWMRLYEEVQRRGVNEVYEQAAYTWFNRLVAIRILQKNGLCEPVSTYADSARTPQIVNQARQGIFPPMEETAKRHLMALLDDDTQVTEQFAVLLVAWCHANPILQRCFGAMADYTELLLPANILAENGFIDLLNHTEFITDDDFQSPELIGWLYQFYIAERKDEVFAKKGKFEADEIPAATQIFTPNWIVKYMVQNTVGRIYLDNNSYMAVAMKDKWQYLVEPAEPTPADAVLHYDELTDLKVADLACGSGHILNECFDLLYDLYITEGYTRAEAITNIFTHNLTGIDLDPRAQQLSLFALTLKACQRDRSFADAHCLPHVLTMPKPYRAEEVSMSLESACLKFIGGYENVIGEMLADDVALIDDAESLGSIMQFNDDEDYLAMLRHHYADWTEGGTDDCPEEIKALIPCVELILALTDKYDALVMNPPYMGGGNMNEVLSKYVKANYEDSKADLFSVFMEVAIDRLKPQGKYGMINMQSWMFLSSFEKLRRTVLDNYHIESMIHLGPRTFDELSGEVVQNTAFVIRKTGFQIDDWKSIINALEALKASKQNDTPLSGAYFRLVDGKNCADKERMFLQALQEHTAKIYYSHVPQANFEKIPGCPIAYWVSDKVREIFTSNLALSAVASPCVGLQTADNARFLRLWSEVSRSRIGFGFENAASAARSGLKWFPYNKGGGYRRWFGQNELVINWENDGQEIKSFPAAVVRNPNYYFKEGITFPRIGSNNFYARYSYAGFVFDCNGPSCFPKTDLNYTIAFLNSKVMMNLLEALCPTLSFQIGDSFKVPFKKGVLDEIQTLSSQNISISKLDWDAHETSWDFCQNELIALIGQTDESLTTLEPQHTDDSTTAQPCAASLQRTCSNTALPCAASLQPTCSNTVPHVQQHCTTHAEEDTSIGSNESVLLSDLMDKYHRKWETIFMQLHANEEELNRQFIDIYGLQDELTPDVPLNEITILQQGEIEIK